MTALTFTFVVLAMSAVAGFLGALTGLGGGVVIVPVLALALGVDIKYAIGASLVSVIATSSGAAATYVREGYSNIRVGMLLEIATTVGAIVGAILAVHVTTHVIAIVFGFVLLQAAYQSFFKSEPPNRVGRARQTLEARQHLPRRRKPSEVWSAECTHWIRTNVRGRHTLRIIGNRLRCTESDCDGPRNEDSI